MKKLPLFVENLVKRILRVPAFFIFAGTTQAEFVDIIALNSVPEDETAANVGIISLNNPDLAPPAGFENGFQTARENGRQIRYHIMDGNPNAWSAVVGNGIEYWQDNSGGALGVELCAGPRSRGVKQRFAMEASKDFCGGYALVWNHYGRVPKSGTLDYSYTVHITAGDPSAEGAQTIGTPLVIESARVPAGGTAKECFFFGIGETDLPAIEKNGLWISITPNTTGTFSAVVSNLRIVKICMAVDKNRDRNVSFGGDDFTSASEPYRFWINNDSDKSGMSEDEVSAIDQSGSAEPDSNNEKPESIRDLEDFSRLQIRFFGDENAMAWIFEKLKSGDLSAQIRSSGSAKIRVWRHLDDAGTLSYIDGGQAQEITGLQTIRVAHGTTPELLFQTKIWKDWSPGNLKYAVRGISVEHPRLNLLFEGVDQGKSQFFAEFSFADRDYQATASVWLELLDVRKMFERVSAMPDEIPAPNSVSWTPQPHSSFGFVNSDSLADKEIISKEFPEDTRIIFVHGWNMSFDGVQSYGATAFKRLWWQNYKGKFSVFYWPTGYSDFWWSDFLSNAGEAVEAYFADYNVSEFWAWEYGESLKNYISDRANNGESVSVAAHSMGNFVAGSALNKGAPIVAYALLNAAVPAECFDGRSEIRNVFTSGISFGNSTKSIRRDIAYLNALNVRRSVRFINFYLEKDKATNEPWEFNRKFMKPKSGYTVSAYDILPYYDEFFGGTRIVNYRHEAVSMCDKSYSLPAGREPRILFNTSENQQNLNLDQFGFGESHSAQFTLPLQKTFKFWKELKLYLTSEKRNKHEKEK